MRLEARAGLTTDMVLRDRSNIMYIFNCETCNAEIQCQSRSTADEHTMTCGLCHTVGCSSCIEVVGCVKCIDTDE